MTVGGAIGSVVPVVGTGLGIAAGKMASDATQWLFGDKKTPEQRKMELALAQLNGYYLMALGLTAKRFLKMKSLTLMTTEQILSLV